MDQSSLPQEKPIMSQSIRRFLGWKSLVGIGVGIVCLVLFALTSCYSVRVRTTEGVPAPDPLSTRTDYYRNMQVFEIDTVIKIKAIEKDFTYNIDTCRSGALHTVEFRHTLGGLLLSAITFGKHRKMKIKYVCIKPSN